MAETTTYCIGIDLGTTYTAAAVYREANAAIFLLGSRGATIPSLVFLRDDQAILTGEAAERRGIVEPTRLAREFKRRVGDSAPIMLGHAPYSAERLMAALLGEVVAAVAAREGSEPAHVAVSHPANWGPFKIDLLGHAVDLAGLRAVTLLTEPEAAALHYASNQRVEPDSTIAVYDLGGGTFDAAVLRKTGTTFAMLGEPEGIERLGGIDFDEAVFAHVRNELAGKLEDLDGSDPSVRVAIGRLRRECVGAKEALSADSETTIPVALPNVHTEIRLTRAELEPMIGPAIGETIEALRRAIERAGIRPEDLDSVLLVGGSSQIPLVSQMVASALGRPVAVDAHPKHSVALGAAVAAARAASSATHSSPPSASRSPSDAVASSQPLVALPVPRTVVTSSAVGPRPEAPAPSPEVGVLPGQAGSRAASTVPPTGDPDAAQGRPGRQGGHGRRIAFAAAAVVLIGGGTVGVYALGSDAGGARENDPQAAAGDGSGTTSTTPASTSTTAAVGLPPCESASGRCARIVDVRIEGDRYVADYEVESFDPVIFEDGVQGTPEDHHVHFFFDTTPPEHAGTNSDTQGRWTVWDRTRGDGELSFDNATVASAQDAEARQLCVLVADSAHGVEQTTGNCVDLPEQDQ